MTDSAARRGLAVVLAHPDDESLACGGTIARCADSGIRVTLICATRGQRGPATGVHDSAALPDVRADELERAAHLLGAERVRFLDYADGMLRWTDPARLENDIARVLLEERPHDVVTFGRDGLYWHPDHVALADPVFRAALSLRPRPAVSCVVMPPGAVAGLVAAVARRVPHIERSLWGIAPELFGHGALAPERVVDVRQVMRRKADAIHCHRSQLSDTHPLAAMTLEEASTWLGFEAFHAAPVEGFPSSGLIDQLAGLA